MSDPELDDFLAHYGVKGMKWGVRRTPEQLGRARKTRGRNQKQTPSSDNPTHDSKGRLSLKNPKVRRAAIVGASIAAIGAAAFVASRYGDVPDRASIAKGVKKTTEILERPTDYIYLTKPSKDSGVTRGGVADTALRFVTKGNTKDYFSVFDNAGLNDVEFEDNTIRKMSNGDVAAIFSDLMGRKDAASRTIPHAVLIPAEKAVGLNSIEDVIDKHGPALEKRYTEMLIRERAKST